MPWYVCILGDGKENKDQWSGQVCECKVAVKYVVKKFLLPTFPFLSLIPCDCSQETATSVTNSLL